MGNFRNIINPHTGKLTKIVSDDYIKSTAATLSWKASVTTIGDLPAVGNIVNDARIVNANKHMYIWNGTEWTDQGEFIDIIWANIDNKPNSSVENIDDAVTKKHDKLHNLNAITVHNGIVGATENNLISFDSNGLPKDSNHKAAEINIAKNIVITLCGNVNNYLFTNNLFYTTFNAFVFSGTGIAGIPANIKIVAHIEKAEDSCLVRIYDVTNSKVICEKSGIVNLTPEVIDLGSLSNLPIGNAVFEIQAKSTDGDEIRISSLAINY